MRELLKLLFKFKKKHIYNFLASKKFIVQ